MKTAKPRNGFQERLINIIGHEKPFAWAKRIGLPSATFSRIYNDGIPPKPDTLLLIAEKTGVCIDWLLTGEGPVYRASAAGADQGRATPPLRPAENERQDHPSLKECLELVTGIYHSGHHELVRELAVGLALCGRLREQWEATADAVVSVRELELRLARLEKRLAGLEKKGLARK